MGKVRTHAITIERASELLAEQANPARINIRIDDVPAPRPAAGQVVVKVAGSGFCHSDLHVCRNDWGGSTYPVIPGHEIVGRVTRVGESVTSFAIGDRVGVGCMVDSCRTCANCRDGFEQ